MINSIKPIAIQVKINERKKMNGYLTRFSFYYPIRCIHRIFNSTEVSCGKHVYNQQIDQQLKMTFILCYFVYISKLIEFAKVL